MDVIERLSCFAGPFRGTNRLHDPETNQPDDSECTAAIQPVLGGRFVRLDYRWFFRGTPQEGSLLIGCERKSGQVSAYWIDTWHMGEKVLVLEGTSDARGKVTVRGSYAAPPGPDWGWRISIVRATDRSLQMLMWNITPEGEEQPAVEASVTRENAGSTRPARASAVSSEPSLRTHFEGKDPVVQKIYDRLMLSLERFGPVRVEPKRTSIHLCNRHGFAGVSTRSDFLLLEIHLNHRLQHPRVTKVDRASANRHHHSIRLTKVKDVDRQLIGWLRAAYDLKA